MEQMKHVPLCKFLVQYLFLEDAFLVGYCCTLFWQVLRKQFFLELVLFLYTTKGE